MSLNTGSEFTRTTHSQFFYGIFKLLIDKNFFSAYQALTDDVARRNYELYGNPDGPGAMHFGIALPSWIVEKENSLWVLGLYGLVFMIGLPTVVAIWWYRSSKFSNDQVYFMVSFI